MSRLTSIVAFTLIGTLATIASSQDTPSEVKKEQDAAPKVAAAPVVAILKTSKGEITVELDAEKAPISVANFVAYAKSGHYNGTIFHRVIRSFMIQTGGLDEKMKEKATMKPIRNESSNGLLNTKYTLAMARKPDPNSATSQFFINTADNAFLNKAKSQDGYGYAVFGKVTAGKEVVDAIEGVGTTTVPPHSDVPREPIFLEAVEIVEAAPEAAPAAVPAVAPAAPAPAEAAPKKDGE